MEGNNSGTVIYILVLQLSYIVYYYRCILHVVVPRVIIAIIIMRLSRVSVRSFLPPRASRPRNIGTYVFTATDEKLFYLLY